MVFQFHIQLILKAFGLRVQLPSDVKFDKIYEHEYMYNITDERVES